MPSELLSKENSYTLRGIAMLAIVLHHIWQHSHFVGGAILDKTGYLGTGIFFMLSGFGMFYSLEKNKIEKSYIIKKIRKMMFPFLATWIVLLFSYPLLGHHFIDCSEWFNIFLFTLPYLECWFFRVIVCVYLICFIVWGINTEMKSNLKITIICVVCLFYVIVCCLAGVKSYWYATILNFPVGMILAYRIDDIRCINRIPVIALSLSLFCVFLLLKQLIFSSLFFSIFSIWASSFFNLKSKLLMFIGTNSLFFYFMETPGIRHFSINSPIVLFILSSLISTSILSLLFVKVESFTNNAIDRYCK